MIYHVKAFSMNRKTRTQTAEPRVEEISTHTNQLFTHCKTAAQVEQAYESFWNDLDPTSEEIVKVMDVRREVSHLAKTSKKTVAAR